MTDKEPLYQAVKDALGTVRRSNAAEDVVAGERVEELRVSDGGEVAFDLRLRPGDPSDLVEDVREAVARVDGVSSVRVGVQTGSAAPRAGDGAEPASAGGSGDPAGGGGPVATAEGAGTPGSGGGEPPSGPRTGSGRSLPVMGQSPSGEEQEPGGGEGPRPTPTDQKAASRHPSDAPPLPNVGHVVAVSSGKGGVGKSTVATNLAAAWAGAGHAVGLLDADVYGPDIPTMFGVHERPRMEDEEVIPLEAHGVKLMSIGFIVEEDTPAIWRGPIIQGVVRQFLRQVRWGELDYLVVDLPPGTGDAQLSLVQLVQVDGGVFVTTPQDVAVGGVLKGIKMFERLEIPVLGIVENMRGFACPGCGEHHDIFGSGGGEKLAASLDLPFLGAVPLGTAVREEGDRGLPTVMGRPDSPEAEALEAIASETRTRILSRTAGDGAGQEPDRDDGDPGPADH